MTYLYLRGLIKSLSDFFNMAFLTAMLFFMNAIFMCTEVQFFCRYLIMW